MSEEKRTRPLNSREVSFRYSKAYRNLDPAEELNRLGIAVIGQGRSERWLMVTPLFGGQSARFDLLKGLYIERGMKEMTLIDLIYRMYGNGKLYILANLCERAQIPPPPPVIKKTTCNPKLENQK